MKQLHEFATLEEAQAYIEYKEISSNKAQQFFSLTGIIAKLKTGMSDITPVELITGMPTNIGNICEAVINTCGKSKEHFEVNPNHPDGVVNQAALTALVSASVITQDEADAFTAQGITYPYKNTTQEEFTLKQPEEFLIGDNPSETVYQLEFTNNPISQANVNIMQRYGDTAESLTEWHSVANFSNVKYSQDTYKVRIPQSTHTIRELKAVSDQSINMTITAV